jgi:hypothetical protein
MMFFEGGHKGYVLGDKVCPATYANDGQGAEAEEHRQENNLEFHVPDTVGWQEPGSIQTRYTKDVVPGEEIKLEYGVDYWDAVRKQSGLEGDSSESDFTGKSESESTDSQSDEGDQSGSDDSEEEDEEDVEADKKAWQAAQAEKIAAAKVDLTRLDRKSVV